MTGIHGTGDPPAAATMGLAEVVHVPKGIIFERNMSSAFPAGRPVVATPFIGSTIKESVLYHMNILKD